MMSLNMEASLATIPNPPRLMPWIPGLKNWTTRWRDDDGKRRMKRFGSEWSMSAREAVAAYKVWLRAWTHDERVKNPAREAETYTVAMLATAYHEHAKKMFVKEGKPTSTAWNVMYAMQALIEAFGDRPAASIDAPDIATVRDLMIYTETKDGTKTVRAISTVNDRLHWIKRAFSLARERGLIPKDNLYDINCVARLVPGRTEAADKKKILPVDEHWVSLTKDATTSVVSAMIDLQWLTGMRPEEVCMIRAVDIDRTEAVWLYTPRSHKMEHKGSSRVIPLGPRCRAIVERFWNRAPTAPLFSPAESDAERLAARRAARKTKLYPSHVKHMAAKRADSQNVGDEYTTASYRKAIHYACKIVQKTHPDAPKWNPNQLRHAAATRLNRTYGLDEVAVLLGHADTDTTRIYALPDVQKAVRIAAEAG